MSTQRIINSDCETFLKERMFTCIFADPPDNIGLKYGQYNDRMPDEEYVDKLFEWMTLFKQHAGITWISFNPKWTLHMGQICLGLIDRPAIDRLDTSCPRPWRLQIKPCVQTFTFGQHNQHDLSNCHRPLWRMRWDDAELYPNNIRVQSWRQKHGDKRADPRGKVPGDVFDFPRVTGNSKQRRKWINTQLHEGLVERCILMSTKPGDWVFDPFAGSGTVLRVCKRLDRNCIATEINAGYCTMIAAENDLAVEMQPGHIETKKDPRFLAGQMSFLDDSAG